jgi:glucose-6-phosphate isomerase
VYITIELSALGCQLGYNNFMDTLQYDYSFMLSEVVKDTGSTQDELKGMQEQMLNMRKQYFTQTKQPLGFMQLPYDIATRTLIEEKAQHYMAHFDTLVVLGIGGSDLGARAVISALRHPYANFMDGREGMRVFFLGGNTDPCEVKETIQLLDLSRTAINVISKSGDTVETMSTFIYLRDLLIQEVGYDAHKKHIIATTDADKGTLRTIVEREGYDSLIVPNNVGGRFSVLSTVGLFPIACAGISIGELLAGAQAYCETFYKQNEQTLHQTEIFAALHYLGYTRHGQNVHVLLPYSNHMRETGFWFRQLWAESLGKKDDLSGKEVFVGPTPVAALGATDQHSQFQLYYEGPFDKVFTFIKVEDIECEVVIPGAYQDITGVAYMKDKKLGDILHAELIGSALALAERRRPNGCIVMPARTPFYVGQLLQFFEVATAYMGGFLHINTYDQPGVELGKMNAYALMQREGFEERASQLQNLMGAMGKYVA